MMNKETYIKELSRYFNSIIDDDCKDELEDPTDCFGVSCIDCIFNTEDERECIYNVKYIFDAFEALEKWSKENPPKKYKISQLEYDILYAKGTNVRFSFYVDIRYLLSKGYFKGATSDMLINDYLDNCEVKEDV